MQEIICFCHPSVISCLEKGLGNEVKIIQPETAAITPDSIIAITSWLPSFSNDTDAGINKLIELRTKNFSNPTVILSFQSYEALLAHPKNQIIAEQGSYYLQLPFSKEEFETIIEQVTPITTSELEIVQEKACSPHSQAETYIQKLISKINEKQLTHQHLKIHIHSLRNFCQLNFGSLLNTIISEVLQFQRESDTNKLMQNLENTRLNVLRAYVYNEFRKLQHGGELDIVNKLLGPLRAVIISNLDNPEEIIDYFQQHVKYNRSLNKISNLMGMASKLKEYRSPENCLRTDKVIIQTSEIFSEVFTDIEKEREIGNTIELIDKIKVNLGFIEDKMKTITCFNIS